MGGNKTRHDQTKGRKVETYEGTSERTWIVFVMIVSIDKYAWVTESHCSQACWASLQRLRNSSNVSASNFTLVSANRLERPSKIFFRLLMSILWAEDRFPSSTLVSRQHDPHTSLKMTHIFDRKHGCHLIASVLAWPRPLVRLFLWNETEVK